MKQITLPSTSRRDSLISYGFLSFHVFQFSLSGDWNYCRRGDLLSGSMTQMFDIASNKVTTGCIPEPVKYTSYPRNLFPQGILLLSTHIFLGIISKRFHTNILYANLFLASHIQDLWLAYRKLPVFITLSVVGNVEGK
jgi:hypothetical protein